MQMMISSRSAICAAFIGFTFSAVRAQVIAGSDGGEAPLYDASKLIKQLHIDDLDRSPYLTLTEWLEQAPTPPAGLSQERKEALYRAWVTLWINTQPAEGAWIKPIISPGAHYMRGIWLWDAGFHIIGLAHGGSKARTLGLWQIEVMLSGQEESGKIAREIWKKGPRSFGRHGIQSPGILTLAANRLLEVSKDDKERAATLEAIRDFYPKLVRNHQWFWDNTRIGNGLCTWTSVDSWDTSPRWDRDVSAAVDLNCWLYLDRLELARMAGSLGKKEDVEKWALEADELRQAINRVHWSDKQGVYNDVLADGSISPCLTPAVFWPLWVGAAMEQRTDGAVRCLEDPKVFAARWPLPSVAVNDPTFRPRDYWRGPVWVNLNWVTIRGLQRYGRDKAADALREKTLDLIARTPVLYESYDPTDGAGLGSPHYGWTAALYIDLVINP